MAELTPLERRALDMLLAGDHPALKTLREQALSLSATDRKFMCAGLFTELQVAPTAPRLDIARTTIRDVSGATKEGRVFGFILFVVGGALAKLECHDFGSGAPCHAEPDLQRLFYVREEYPGSPEETAQRDLDALKLG